MVPYRAKDARFPPASYTDPAMKTIRPLALLAALLLCAFCPALLRAQAAADKLTPNDLVNRGLTKQEKGDFDGALADYEQALALDPKFIRALGNRANVKKERQDFAGAIADYSRILELDPQSVQAHILLGEAKRGKGDFEGAMADYSRAIELEPKFYFAYIGRGMAKAEKGDFNGAINDFTSALEINPEDMLMVSTLRINAKRLKGDLDGAMADVNRMLALDPKFSAAIFLRAFIRQDKGDFDGAIADYSRAIEIEPKDAATFSNRGHAKRAKGDLDGAIADFSRAIELEPNVALRYLHRGIAKRAKQDATGSLVDFRQGAKLDDLYSAFWVLLVQAESGQRDSGAKELTEALGRAKKPGTDDERWTAQVGDFLLGKATSTNFLAQANTAEDGYAQRWRLCQAWFYQGMLQKIAGQRAEAMASFRKAIVTERKDLTEYLEAVRELKALEAGAK
jgi:tetratricopeptide (TPR) repeat protein